MSRKYWTVLDIWKLQDMIDQGFSIQLIAKRLGRSYNSVDVKTKRLGLRPRKSPNTLSVQDAAQLLGIPCSKTITLWIAERGLPACNASNVSDKAFWRIELLALYEWLEQRTNWMCYNPNRIPDQRLREHLIDIRRGKRWLTAGEVAERYHVHFKTVNTWIREGCLPAERWGNWWIFESDLKGFIPPYDHPRGNTRRDIPDRDRKIAQVVELREKHTLKEIAQRFDVSVTTVARWYQQVTQL